LLAFIKEPLAEFATVNIQKKQYKTGDYNKCQRKAQLGAAVSPKFRPSIS
jgi:hypothetical protein